MKEHEKQQVNEHANTQAVDTTSDGIMDLFEIINAGGDEGEIKEIVGREENSQDHSLVCNNELFNKELWAIVDDTATQE